MTKAENRSGRRARAWLAPVVAFATAGALGACDSLFEVENPNNLVQEDIEQPEAGTALANGALSTVARGLGEYGMAPLTASDELKWIGSRDAWNDLDIGNLDNPSNEFTDDAWNWLAEGRWMADLAITQLTKQDGEGTIVARIDLARANLWAGIVYTYIGDWLDDYAFSDRAESGPPVGEANMDQVYDKAVGYLNTAGDIATAEGDGDLAAFAMAQRARAKHGKAVWGLLNPPGSTPSNPWIGSSSGASADALQAIQMVGGSLTLPVDFRWEFAFSPATVTNDIGWQVNERLEHRFGDVYIIPSANDKTREETRLQDPIDNIIDPAADAIMDRFEAGGIRPRDASFTITTVREMLLIIAEARMADGDDAGAITVVNALRGLDDLTAYDPAVHTDITLEELIIKERFANLMLAGRLLNDHYRFGIKSDLWLSGSIAANQPGVIFPISIGERQSNTCITTPGSC